LEKKKKKKDVNECDEGTDNCDFDATCSNTEGSYSCACNEGYSGDGFTCNGNRDFFFLNFFFLWK